MSVKSKVGMLLGLLMALMLLTGCVGAFLGLDVAAVEDTAVTIPMQYLQGPQVGPLYNVTLSVPGDWVGNFRTRNVGNVVYFEYVGGGDPALIFTIDALSSAQYWKQSGSYPGSYRNIVNKGDTYFIYHLPIDAYYSGLSEAEFTAFSDAVPGIIATFQVAPAQ